MAYQEVAVEPVRRSAPRFHAPVRKDASLARGLIVALNPAGSHLRNVAGPGGSFTGTPTIAPREAGLAAETSGTVSYTLADATWNRPSEITVLAFANRTGTAVRYTNIVTKDFKSGGAPSYATWGIEVNQGGANQNELSFFTSTSADFNRTGSYTSGDLSRPFVSVLRRTASVLSGFFNGTKVGESTGLSALTYGATGANDISVNSIYNRSPFAVYLVLMWDRALSDAEIATISRNPWQVFEPDDAPVFYSAGGGSTSAATITAADGLATTSTIAGSSTAAASIAQADGTASASTIAGSSIAAADLTPAAGVATASTIVGAEAGSTASGTPQTAAGAATTSTIAGSSVAASDLVPAAGAATASTIVGLATGVIAADIVPAEGVATAHTIRTPDVAGNYLGGAPLGRKTRRNEYEFLNPAQWVREDVAEPAQAQQAQQTIKRRIKTLERWKDDLAAMPVPERRQHTDMAPANVQRWIDEYNRLASQYMLDEIRIRIQSEQRRREAFRREQDDIESLLLLA